MTMRTYGLIPVLVVGLALTGAGTRAAVNTSNGSGSWETGGTWSDGVPTSDDDVYIQAGHTVTINGLATNEVNSLTVTGVLTHADNSTVEAHKIILDIGGDLTVVSSGANRTNASNTVLQSSVG